MRFRSYRNIALACALAVISSAVGTAAYANEDNLPTKGQLARTLEEAKQGDAEAQYQIAEAYLEGEGVHQDEKEAAEWYYKSAMQGYTPAQFAMGFVYRGGNGIPIDKVLSYMWFDLAAKNGDERAASLRDNVASAMTQTEVNEAQQKSDEWKPERKHYLGSE
ncbi:MAG TPA: tetratricopeptide repeat protein [Rickettsiales bacterium]|nr:tetratricopeptide repeat protein [Rickettsiales bacterium]